MQFYQIFVRNPEGARPFVIPSHGWEGNTILKSMLWKYGGGLREINSCGSVQGSMQALMITLRTVTVTMMEPWLALSYQCYHMIKANEGPSAAS
jgi:hypothetical protein